MQRLTPVVAGRLVVFLAVVVYLSAGPVTHQLLGMRRVPGLMVWRMYAGKGRGLCDVQYYQRTGAGDVRLDRYALLDAEPWYTASTRVRWIHRAEEVVDMGRRLCRNLEGGFPDVRADARCSTRSGWTERFAREENLCVTTFEQVKAGRLQPDAASPPDDPAGSLR